jgi:hypothetical protein
MTGGLRLLRIEFAHFWVPGRHLRLDRRKMGSLGYSCIVIVSVRVSHERRVITLLPFILSAARADSKLNRHIAKKTHRSTDSSTINPHSHVFRATRGCLQLLAQRCCGGSQATARSDRRTTTNPHEAELAEALVQSNCNPYPLFSNGPAAVPEPD